MRKLAALGLCLGVWSSNAQTNEKQFHSEWFVAPQLSLRPPVPDEKPILQLPEFKPQIWGTFQSETIDFFPLNNPPGNLTEELGAGGRYRDFDFQIYGRLDREGYFARIEQPGSQVDRFVDAVFAPEVMHFRKVSVSCSIVTAFKRKNPLCLINPCVLQVTW